MFEDIISEINLFPITDEQKEYIKTALNLAYDKGKKEGMKESSLISNSSEVEDQKLV